MREAHAREWELETPFTSSYVRKFSVVISRTQFMENVTRLTQNFVFPYFGIIVYGVCRVYPVWVVTIGIRAIVSNGNPNPMHLRH